ncbi:MAG TPA: AAA family ATPase, partial [Gemmataceae bacterium]
LYGPPKLGKSFFAPAAAVTVATGVPIIEGITARRTGQVLYLSYEDGFRRIRKRFLKMLEGLLDEWPQSLDFSELWPGGRGGLELLHRYLDDHADTALVIVDTLGHFRNGFPFDRSLDPYQRDVNFMRHFRDLNAGFEKKHGTPLAALLIHHDRKAESADEMDAASGTKGLTGSADTALFLKRSRGGTDGELFLSGRDTEERKVATAWDPDRLRWRLIDSPDTLAEGTNTARVYKALCEADEALRPVDLAARVQMKDNAVRTYLHRLAKDGYVSGDGKKGYRARATDEAVERAKAWLRDHLGVTPKLCRETLAAARRDNLIPDAVFRAAEQTGIAVVDGEGGKYFEPAGGGS